MTLFMATLGLSFVIEGLAQTLFGAQVHGLDLGIDDVPMTVAHVSVSKLDLFAAATAGGLVLVLAVLFNRTRLGISLRAVADDPLAALAIGIDLRRVWAVVWAVSGVVGLVAGLLWGARLGVQFSLSLIVLKALPVLIIGGLDSIPGTIVGGLLIGASEKLAEVYIGPYFGGGIENCVISGLPRLSARHAERLVRAGAGGASMTTLQRASTVVTRLPLRVGGLPLLARGLLWAVFLLLAFVVVPLAGSDYLFQRRVDPVSGAVAGGAQGVNLLTGYTGQLSLGSAAFMAVRGAFATYDFSTACALAYHCLSACCSVACARAWSELLLVCQACASKASICSCRRSRRSFSWSGLSLNSAGFPITMPPE